jgi:transposase
MTKRPRRVFTEEFKKQMVQLYQSGKSRQDLIKEYDLSPSALDKWVMQNKQSGSFKEKDNRSPKENELLQLRKEIQQLKMENDILKQAALILGRK